MLAPTTGEGDAAKNANDARQIRTRTRMHPSPFLWSPRAQLEAGHASVVAGVIPRLSAR